MEEVEITFFIVGRIREDRNKKGSEKGRQLRANLGNKWWRNVLEEVDEFVLRKNMSLEMS